MKRVESCYTEGRARSNRRFHELRRCLSLRFELEFGFGSLGSRRFENATRVGRRGESRRNENGYLYKTDKVKGLGVGLMLGLACDHG